MSTVAFIFARGGSKELPGKNIRAFRGKPLIAWSIECALSVKSIDRVIVSTDSEEIAETSRNYGADVPFMRPRELAGDECPEWLSWKHALEYFRYSSGALPDAMVSLPATSPLRTVSDIERCLVEFAKGSCDVVVTVSKSHRNPYFNMVRDKSDGTVALVIEGSQISRRQDAPVIRDLATVCYVAKPEFVLSHNSIFEGRVKAVNVPKERAIDIDSLLDFQIAEFLFSTRKEI